MKKRLLSIIIILSLLIYLKNSFADPGICNCNFIPPNPPDHPESICQAPNSPNGCHTCYTWSGCTNPANCNCNCVWNGGSCTNAYCAQDNCGKYTLSDVTPYNTGQIGTCPTGTCSQGWQNDCYCNCATRDYYCSSAYPAAECNYEINANCNGEEYICIYYYGSGTPGIEWKKTTDITTEKQDNNINHNWCNDGHDNDCDYSIDCQDPDCFDDPVCCQNITYYQDNDGDGWGNATATNSFCEPPPGWTQNNDDCNDNNILIHPPPPTETGTNCENNIDDDCNNKIDCADIGCITHPNCAATIIEPINPITIPEETPTFFHININNPWKHTGINTEYTANPPVHDASLWKLNNNDTWAFSWTPNYTMGRKTSQTYTFTFTLNDNSNYDEEETTITVNNINQPPTITEPTSNDGDEGGQSKAGNPTQPPQGRTIEFWILNEETLTFNVTATDPDFDYDHNNLRIRNTSWTPNTPIINFSYKKILPDKWELNWTAPDVQTDTTFNTTIKVNDTLNANDTINITIHVQLGTIKIPMQCGDVTINNTFGFYPACYPQPDYADCIGQTDCVYANTTTTPTCHPRRTTLNDTTLPLNARKEITCSNNNTWCPKGMRYRDDIKYCVLDHDICDAGYYDTYEPIYHCWNITSMLEIVNIPICFPEIPGPATIPYNVACCKFYNYTNIVNGTYYLGETNNIIVI